MTNETINFLSPEISQSELAVFAEERVNLKRDQANKYREQVSNLRDHLDRYITEHEDIGLKKMLLSGSLAKGTALRTVNDIDVAVYVKSDGAPNELAKLLEWLVERLRTTYFNIPKEKIYIDGPCVVISFSGTGINVDVAPILYDGDADWRGYLWDRTTNKRILTSIPLHLEFIKKRKEKQPTHFSQTIRLVKWWAAQRMIDTDGFTMRSFFIELILAKLADKGTKFDDYHSGLEAFFVYIQKSGLNERIAFTDNYPLSKLPSKKCDIVEVFDPVNPENNVADNIDANGRKQIIELADQALDALSYARNSQTRSDAIECWKELMGASFNL